jgi:ATP-dependent Clp protease ATP-binding subunit ClpA
LLELYSLRARRIIFLTRRVAGRQGAAALEPEHLIEAFVLEDQGEKPKKVGVFGSNTVSDSDLQAYLQQPQGPNRLFLAPETAAEILSRLELASVKSEPIPDSLDMPISPALGRTLKSAMALKDELKQKNVEPLHLLAAELSQDSKAAQILKDVGLTTEQVIAAIESGEYF